MSSGLPRGEYVFISFFKLFQFNILHFKSKCTTILLSEEPAPRFPLLGTGSSPKVDLLEAYLSLTDSANNSQDYWYIRVPTSRCSQPDFHFFDQVGFHWEDGDGNHYYDIGEIIGIKYIAKGDESGEWYYLMRYLKCDFEPSLNGVPDEDFQPQSSLVADDIAIAQDE